MYPILLKIHQIASWFLLLAAAWALVRSWRGMIFGKSWLTADKRAAFFLVLLTDLQVLAGLILYFVYSPLTRIIFSNFSATMSDTQVRFYAVEHIAVMLIALIVVHMGRANARKAQFANRKHRISAIFFTIATLLILSRIPWERIFVI
jgi:hypothetical protein